MSEDKPTVAIELTEEELDDLHSVLRNAQDRTVMSKSYWAIGGLKEKVLEALREAEGKRTR